jgi:uncharacterized protein YsxB (DUF464 family)
MIVTTYSVTKKGLKRNVETNIFISGHSGFGNGGPDIVCSACSMLACLLEQMVRDEEAFGHMVEMHISREAGELNVRFIPRVSYQASLIAIERTIETGFKMLENSYPQHVCVKGEKFPDSMV